MDTTTVYGHSHPVRMPMPIFTGAIGSTDVARRNWERLAVGAAISGITIVCGENVCGIDPELETKDGRVTRSPEMERRVKTYREWQEGYGDRPEQIFVTYSTLKGKYGERTKRLASGRRWHVHFH